MLNYFNCKILFQAKMKLLTFMQLAETKSEITFGEIQQHMQLGENEVEEFLIDRKLKNFCGYLCALEGCAYTINIVYKVVSLTFKCPIFVWIKTEH